VRLAEAVTVPLAAAELPMAEESPAVEEEAVEEEAPAAQQAAELEEAPSEPQPAVPELTAVRSPTPRDTQVQKRSERTTQAMARSRRRSEDQSSDEIVLARGDRALGKDAILGELEFSRGLIQTYRKYQMKIV
jgi:hypothetical protein